MTREEFEEKVKYFGMRCYSEASYFEKGDRPMADIQVKLQVTSEAEIMAEFDRLTAQLAEANKEKKVVQCKNCKWWGKEHYGWAKCPKILHDFSDEMVYVLPNVSREFLDFEHLETHRDFGCVFGEVKNEKEI